MVRVVRIRRGRPNPDPAVAKSDDCRKRVARADMVPNVVFEVRWPGYDEKLSRNMCTQHESADR